MNKNLYNQLSEVTKEQIEEIFFEFSELEMDWQQKIQAIVNCLSKSNPELAETIKTIWSNNVQ